ncbi:MAG: AsmA family protein, partial [Methylotenera sp.]
MKKYKKILFSIGLIVIALVILPFLVPTQSYLQKAERIASDKLGVPVTIANGHF